MKNILFILLSLLLFSCKSYRKAEEYIELRSRNSIVFTRNKIYPKIKLIPTNSKKKKNVIVVRSTLGYDLTRRKITYEEYLKIKKLVLSIQQDDLERNRIDENGKRKVNIIDGSSLTIKMVTKENSKELILHGLSKKHDGDFYTLVEFIVKSAKLEMIDVL